MSSLFEGSWSDARAKRGYLEAAKGGLFSLSPFVYFRPLSHMGTQERAGNRNNRDYEKFPCWWLYFSTWWKEKMEGRRSHWVSRRVWREGAQSDAHPRAQQTPQEPCSPQPSPGPRTPLPGLTKFDLHASNREPPFSASLTQGCGWRGSQSGKV